MNFGRVEHNRSYITRSYCDSHVGQHTQGKVKECIGTLKLLGDYVSPALVEEVAKKDVSISTKKDKGEL